MSPSHPAALLQKKSPVPGQARDDDLQARSRSDQHQFQLNNCDRWRNRTNWLCWSRNQRGFGDSNGESCPFEEPLADYPYSRRIDLVVRDRFRPHRLPRPRAGRVLTWAAREPIRQGRRAAGKADEAALLDLFAGARVAHLLGAVAPGAADLGGYGGSLGVHGGGIRRHRRFRDQRRAGRGRGRGLCQPAGTRR